MLYFKIGPAEAGNRYDLVITGLKLSGSSEDMGTLRIRISR